MIFRRAAIRLTLAYTAIQLILFAVFAIAIYVFVTGAFDFDTVESDGGGGADAAEQGFRLLRRGLVIIYAALLIVIPLSSWLMARAALRPIKASFEQQQQFVDGASHEMRTPLSVIQGELELALTRSRTVAEYQAAISTSLEAVNGLTRLTDDLLGLAQTATGEPSTTFAPVDLNAAVRGVVARASGDRTSGPIVRAHFGQQCRVWGSDELISRAIGNAVDNALKFGSASDNVDVSTSVAGETCIVQVRDYGVGMTDEQVSHAFERFWRADDARSTPGHGLGLALVQQIMQAHGGSVSLDSQHGHGTTVTFRFPRSTR
ncbi:MAG: hypothetical protein JWL94_585 [Microbacteriaceae bacterium]|nr:hypothetical protein [Microbacteriaceae bacterium]HEV7956234.1 HAMP domain-containing sensor histidine kinase [Marisediminicola sp.]